MINERLVELPSGAVLPSGVLKKYTNDIGSIYLANGGESILSPSGLFFPNNPVLSNGAESRYIAGASGITDFKIINDYIHNKSYDTGSPKAKYLSFNPSGFLELATIRFNIYTAKYRIVPKNDTDT